VAAGFRFQPPVSADVTLPGTSSALLAALPTAPLALISSETLLVLGAYAALGGAYLVVVPLVLLWWMTKRWTLMGKIERTAVYGLVFLFFPGLIVFAPFVNLRMAGQGPQPS
jgi:NAD(P)H-quinone oxidoreductase subunit L